MDRRQTPVGKAQSESTCFSPEQRMKTPNQALQPTAQTASFSWMSSVASVLSRAATCVLLSRG